MPGNRVAGIQFSRLTRRSGFRALLIASALVLIGAGAPPGYAAQPSPEGVTVQILKRGGVEHGIPIGYERAFGIIRDVNGLICETRFDGHYYYSSVDGLLNRLELETMTLPDFGELLPDGLAFDSYLLDETGSSFPAPVRQRWHLLVQPSQTVIAAYEDSELSAIISRRSQGVFLDTQQGTAATSLRLDFYDLPPARENGFFISDRPAASEYEQRYGINYDPLTTDGVLLDLVWQRLAIYNYPRDTLALCDAGGVVAAPVCSLLANSGVVHGACEPVGCWADFTDQGMLIAVTDTEDEDIKLCYIPIASKEVAFDKIELLAVLPASMFEPDARRGTLMFWQGVVYLCLSDSLLAIHPVAPIQ